MFEQAQVCRSQRKEAKKKQRSINSWMMIGALGAALAAVGGATFWWAGSMTAALFVAVTLVIAYSLSTLIPSKTKVSPPKQEDGSSPESSPKAQIQHTPSLVFKGKMYPVAETSSIETHRDNGESFLRELSFQPSRGRN